MQGSERLPIASPGFVELAKLAGLLDEPVQEVGEFAPGLVVPGDVGAIFAELRAGQALDFGAAQERRGLRLAFSESSSIAST